MLLHAFIAAVVLTAPASPRHLVVLTHGLYGGAANLIVLEQKLQAIGGPTVLVHRAQCNEGQTRDGVAAGGRRLAEEVKKVAASHPSLRSHPLSVIRSVASTYDMLQESSSTTAGWQVWSHTRW